MHEGFAMNTIFEIILLELFTIEIELSMNQAKTHHKVLNQRTYTTTHEEYKDEKVSLFTLHAAKCEMADGCRGRGCLWRIDRKFRCECHPFMYR